MTKGEALHLRNLIETLAATLDDETALTGIELFPLWISSSKQYNVGDRVRYDSTLYKCVQAHSSQDDWMPDVTPSLWVKVSIDEWPEWTQPTGAHEAYANGAKVVHNGAKWISTVDNNVWEPGVYGWEKTV